MKKVIFALLFSVITVAGMAQVSLGLKAGANITNFTGGDFDAVKKKSIVGFHGGGYLNFALGALSLQPEVLVSTQGARIDSVSGSYDWKVTYLTVPVMLRYRSTGGFYLEAGPQFGFKLNEDVKNETIDAFAKNLDLSAGAGIGFQTKGGFGIGGRYLVGLSKVGDFDASDSGGIDPDFKNSVIQVGIFFKLSK
jgi:Outer membrane protein beta-barrel domain